ncbi:unnamed protein product [Cuscuta campestris]|uniref:TF-B3 domain-containing protein n=1 Tax=Cuscuta campestris TaxID=132261 RepID=A0A484K0B2_9ASTE|nr:unnamed protein product [Cuscuta campestris]
MESSSKKCFSFDLNDHDDDHAAGGEDQVAVLKDHLFEKPLTPSDVGKLNRLVIPKQNAEKYFPLTGQDSSSPDKGLLLTFEEDSGKLWRFRYSYWNSSQSYVLTKGWSRFVKEKRLDAGDVVLFLRHRLDGDRFFIGWRRRSNAGGVAANGVREEGIIGGGGGLPVAAAVVRGGWSQSYYPYQLPADFAYQPQCLHAGSTSIGQCQTPSSGSSKTLRLFGVNMECQAAEPVRPDGLTMTSQQVQTGHHYLYQYYSNPMASSYNNHYIHTEEQDENYTS